MDDEDCERRRIECLDEMNNLEKQFTDLKDQYVYYLLFLFITHKRCYIHAYAFSNMCICLIRLYKERLNQVDAKLQEVMSGKAPEYLEPLATLQENMQIRTKVAGQCDVLTKRAVNCLSKRVFLQGDFR